MGDLECTKQEEAFVNCKKILFQRINVRTRDNNILDLILTSETSIVEDVKILEHLLPVIIHNTIEFQFILKTVMNAVVIYKHDFRKMLLKKLTGVRCLKGVMHLIAMI